MKTLNLLFVGTDRQALSRIESALLGLVFIEIKSKITPHIQPDNYDLIIVDCRKTVSNVKAIQIPALALIRLCDHQRNLAYAKGFSDYLAWPLIDREIRQRFKGVREIITTQGQNPLVVKACKYLMENIDNTCNLSSLCQAVGTNPTSLTQQFQSALSTTPMSWLRQQRLLLAADYLAESQIPITEIAMHLGYQDSNNFSTSFKKHYGMSPRQYRNKIKLSKDID